ncbi:MAG: hypothetical protein F9K44_01770 [Hyphomicrobiaceae bacterium]|nr:MAG: hypothetical protein F9K44_01770 [Hyphomicrobiaceae bacterium]
MGVAASIVLGGPAHAETTRVPMATIATTIQSVLRGTQVHLNNYGRRHGNSWHKPNDSFVRLSAALGGREARLTLPEVRGPAGRRYYVNDFNLSSVDASASGSAISLVLQFESRGIELKGRCSGNITCFGASDDAAPDFNINNARLLIPLVPVRHGGDLAYATVNATFSATVDGRGLGELIEGLVQRTIKREVEQAVEGQLNSADVRNRIASELRSRVLAPLRIGAITGIRVDGANLVIDHRR